jgi:hypothetical protein
LESRRRSDERRRGRERSDKDDGFTEKSMDQRDVSCKEVKIVSNYFIYSLTTAAISIPALSLLNPSLPALAIF